MTPWITAASETLRRVGAFPLAVFLAHVICARALDGYRRFPPIDMPMHIAGGLAIACFIAGALTVCTRRDLIPPPGRLVAAAVVIGLTALATIAWEFAEWTSDRVLNTVSQISLNDTLADMLCGLLGGAVVSMRKH